MGTGKSPLVQVESGGPIATLTLNRPERHNSLVPQLLRELLDAHSLLKSQPGLRAVVLQANGRSFSTGGDVQAFYDHRSDIRPNASEVVGLLNQTILGLVALPVPVIAAVHGIVTGGSLGLVLGCDIVLVAPAVTFTPYYTAVGYSPDGGWTAMLPDIVGRKRAAEIQMLNETITAEQAVAWGIANRIVPADRMRESARLLAETLVRLKPGSLARTKQLLWGDKEALAARLEAERRQFVEHIAGTEAMAGMEAFLQKAKS
jgi:enoyl-CoA hydratase/carnithine racemase